VDKARGSKTRSLHGRRSRPARIVCRTGDLRGAETSNRSQTVAFRYSPGARSYDERWAETGKNAGNAPSVASLRQVGLGGQKFFRRNMLEIRSKGRCHPY
jgi:hypothetical protein